MRQGLGLGLSSVRIVPGAAAIANYWDPSIVVPAGTLRFDFSAGDTIADRNASGGALAVAYGTRTRRPVDAAGRKWYFDMLVTRSGGFQSHWMGIATTATYLDFGYVGGDNQAVAIQSNTGNARYNGNVTAASVGALVNGDRIMMAVDFAGYLTTGAKVWIGKNSVWQGDPAAGTGEAVLWYPTGTWAFRICFGSSSPTNAAELGVGYYAPPAGFLNWATPD